MLEDKKAYMEKFGVEFESELSEILTLALSKHSKYGPKPIIKSKGFGILLRQEEKIERLKNIYEDGEFKTEESVEEDLRDIAVYSILAIMYRRGFFECVV